MVVAKHLPPIQPYPPQHHDTPVQIAPSEGAVGADQTKRRQDGPRKGLVIRTSKHWVLPPRPKPGRKPSERRRAAAAAATAAAAAPTPSTGVSSAPTSIPIPTPTPAPGPPGTPVSPGTSSIKKDLSKLPIKNVNPPNKAPTPASNTASSSSNNTNTQEGSTSASTSTSTSTNSTNTLTPCVSPSPPKRTKTSLKREIQHIKSENTKLKQELGLLVGNLQDLKHKFKQVEAQEENDNYEGNSSNCHRKRHLDESLAFLKFEDDEESLPPLLSSNKMNPSSSTSSRTNLTDDEDLLTVSSSTPNSVFSLDLQQTHSSSSSCSRSHSKSSPTNEKSQLRFLDTFEQAEFGEKHAEKLLATPIAPTTQTTTTNLSSVELPLSSIKEEENDQFSWIDPAKEEASILEFLQTHQEMYTDPIEGEAIFDNINKVTSDDNKTINNNNTNGDQNNNNSENDDLFQNLSLAAPLTATATTSACYVPPSLEELMEEQDGGFINNSNSNTTLTNVNDYDDDFDMLRTQVFDMA